MKKALKFLAAVAVAIFGVSVADRKLGWGLAEWAERTYDWGVDKISRKNNSEAVETETTAEQ